MAKLALARGRRGYGVQMERLNPLRFCEQQYAVVVGLGHDSVYENLDGLIAGAPEIKEKDHLVMRIQRRNPDQST